MFYISNNKARDIWLPLILWVYDGSITSSQCHRVGGSVDDTRYMHPQVYGKQSVEKKKVWKNAKCAVSKARFFAGMTSASGPASMLDFSLLKNYSTEQSFANGGIANIQKNINRIWKSKYFMLYPIFVVAFQPLHQH